MSGDTRAGRPGLEEIIVTARRRPEPTQRVPVSVVSLSAKDLESRSVTNLRSLQRFVPNITFAPSQNTGEAASNAFIRGIGQEDFGVGAEPGVGFYVDGVYHARSLGTLMNLYDVERVEVLRGPQGTLFGKNTIGGAINITSVLPRPDAESRASVILGNFQRVEGRAIVNQPLSGRLLARLSAGLVSRDGFVRRLRPEADPGLLEELNWRSVDLDREGDDRNQAARLQLRWLATDKLTLDVSLDGSRRRGQQGATHLDAVNPAVLSFVRINALIDAGLLPGPPISPDLITDDLLESRATGRSWLRQDFWGASARLTAQTPVGTLSVLGAHRAFQSHLGTDTDGLHFDIAETDLDTTQSQWSGELQLSGARGPLNYTAGLFMLREDSKILPTSANPTGILFTCRCFYEPGQEPTFFTDPRSLRASSQAIYGQGTVRLTDRLSITAGARHSRETKSVSGTAFLLDADLRPTDTIVGTGFNKDRWHPFTFRAGAEYQAARDFMTYVSVARGYKSGGFNVRVNLNQPNLGFYGFRPETALTYEAGVRSEWFDRRIRLNATVFHTRYRDMQLRQQSFVNGIVTTLIENAAKARIRGAELELAAVVSPALRVSAAYGHLDPRYLDVGAVPGLRLDSKFQRTPRHSFTTSIDVHRPLAGGTLELHGDYSYRSKEQFQITPAINDQDGYGLIDARATFRTRDGRWAIALFGTNLADVRYRTAGRGTLLAQAGIAYSSIGLPRQIGLQVSAGF